MESPYRITNPIEQNFSCNSCGKCCSRAWKVKVAKDKLPELESTQAYARIKKAGFQPLRLVNEEFQVGRQGDGACRFLRDKGCDIHREKGLAAKPVVCQLYPFSLINSPDGYFASLSFSCPTVLEGTGRPVAQHLPELEQAMTDSSYFPPLVIPKDRGVALTQEREISWTEYLALEQQLLEVLDSDDPIRALLRAAVSLTIQSQQTEGFQWNKDELSLPLLQEAAMRFPLFASYTVASLETYGREHERETLSRVLLEDDLIPSQLLGYDLPTFEVQDVPNDTTRNLVHRYIKNLILGKQLISVAPLVSRLLMLAVALAVLFYYLEVKIERRSGREFHMEDLAWCFSLIETSLMSHSESLVDVFKQYESLLIETHDAHC